MNANVFSLAILALLVSSVSLAQSSREGERPVRPDSASNAAIGGWCDALTGAKKEECLRDERRRQQEKKGASTRGSCDALFGPDKELCLRQGGTVEVDARPDASQSPRASH